MLIDLNTYIRVDEIRRKLEKSCEIITTIEEANNFAFRVAQGQLGNVIFEKTSLKNYCFSRIKSMCSINIVNCNSNIERYNSSIQECSDITIFDNVHLCKNLDIINDVLNKKGIVVC